MRANFWKRTLLIAALLAWWLVLAAVFALAAFGCGAPPWSTVGCHLDGSYLITATPTTVGCEQAQWVAHVGGQPLDLDCRVPLNTRGFRGSAQCDDRDGVVQTCSGMLRGTECSYSVLVELCEREGCE